MFRFFRVILVLALCAALNLGCDSGDEAAAPVTPTSGAITAVVQHILGREDDVLTIAVYDSSLDWSPWTGEDQVIYDTVLTIDSAHFSISLALGGLAPEMFEPATYSVVFKVSMPNSGPDQYAEVRVNVNGNVTASAPVWADWLPMPEQSGQITATAEHILGRDGDYLMIAVFADTLDWYPGAPNDAIISRTITPIDSANFSFSHVMQEIDSQQQETGIPMEFDPATYSVVFFIGEAGPPDVFAEIRAYINGDITVQAPAWPW